MPARQSVKKARAQRVLPDSETKQYTGNIFSKPLSKATLKKIEKINKENGFKSETVRGVIPVTNGIDQHNRLFDQAQSLPRFETGHAWTRESNIAAPAPIIAPPRPVSRFGLVPSARPATTTIGRPTPAASETDRSASPAPMKSGRGDIVTTATTARAVAKKTKGRGESFDGISKPKKISEKSKKSGLGKVMAVAHQQTQLFKTPVLSVGINRPGPRLDAEEEAPAPVRAAPAPRPRAPARRRAPVPVQRGRVGRAGRADTPPDLDESSDESEVERERSASPQKKKAAAARTLEMIRAQRAEKEKAKQLAREPVVPKPRAEASAKITKSTKVKKTTITMEDDDLEAAIAAELALEQEEEESEESEEE